MKQNKPKFQVGDIVVVIMYGTVGTITKVHQIDKHYLYEVNHNEVLYFESSIQLYKDYEGVIVDMEKLDIEYEFLIGDVVYVKDYGKELFRIIGHRTEIWRYLEDGWEDIIYELTRLKDGEWLETEEEDLTLVLRKYEMTSLCISCCLSIMSEKLAMRSAKISHRLLFFSLKAMMKIKIPFTSLLCQLLMSFWIFIMTTKFCTKCFMMKNIKT